jgi:AcrR family transcriptional regulator
MAYNPGHPSDHEFPLTEHAAADQPASSQQADALLEAACAIVERDGLAGLTLRPLAEALGVSVSALTKRYGARAGVIGAVCAQARARDALLCEGWQDLLASLAPVPPGLAAELAEAILDDLETRGRPLSRLFLELLHACSWDDSLRGAFAPWVRQRRAFWQRLASSSLPVALHDWWNGYALAELAHGLVLHAMPDYRILRRLCLRRLFAGRRAPGPDAADARLFALVAARMREGDGEPAACLPAGGPMAGRVARACGIRLAAQGVAALTHRAVALEVGIPHTTLSYRFPAQRDLVAAGLDYILAHVLAAVDASALADVERLRTEGDGHKLDLARASLAVAIAAARMPELVPRTATLRSRRGENLAKVLGKVMPEASGIDALCVQIVSMGLAGLTSTIPPGKAADEAVAAAFAAAATWLREAPD